MKGDKFFAPLISALILLVAPNAWSQVLEERSTGAPGTIYNGSNIDEVDTSSGNLRITLPPLLHLPGRGLDTDIVLTYNSKIWFTDCNYDEFGDCIPVTGIDPDTNGFDMFGHALNSFPALGWGLGVPRMGRRGGSVSWVAVDGTRTPLAGDSSQSSQVTSRWSYDGTYMRAIYTDLGGGTGRWTNRYKDGVAAIVQSWGDMLLDEMSLKDTNGNFVKCLFSRQAVPPGSSYGKYTHVACTDTLGRVIDFNYANDQLSSMTYLDSSGQTQSVTFSYQTFAVNYPFGGAFTITPPDPGAPVTYSPPYSETYTLPLLTKVTLPNGRAYEFEYLINTGGTTTAEITKVKLPTGGYIRYTYDWTTGIDPVWSSFRGVANRYVSSDGNPGSEATWSYNIGNASACGGQPTTVTDPLGNMEVHSFPANYTRKIEYKNASGTVLKTVVQVLAFDDSSYNPWPKPSSLSLTQSACPANPRVTSITTTLNDTNQQSKVTMTYGTHGNVTRRDEYNWGTGAPGSLARYTTFTYLHNSNTAYADKAVHILNRVTIQKRFNASGVLQAQADTAYDSTPITATSGIAQHDYISHPSTYTKRGNPTLAKRWLISGSQWLTTTNNYNDVGNLLQSTDPGNHSVTFSYADNFADQTPSQPTSAFVTQTTYPTTAGVSHFERKQHYFRSGLIAASCGQNFPSGSACTNAYSPPQSDYTRFTYDGLNRVKTIVQGEGGQTTLTYNEGALPISIASTTTITATQSVVSTTVYDGLGRQKQTQLNSDPEGVVYADVTYDALGRRVTESNPYRSTSDPTYGITAKEFDALGRVIKVIPPDGTATSNNLSTSYVGNCATGTDQAGKIRKSCSDALGRLIQVFEPNASNALIYETAYQYDVLNNLTRVDQKGGTTDTAQWRTRTFTYDSLSRLTRAINPESGTTDYTYDSDSNLLTRVAPKPNQTGSLTVTTTFSYDVLHRVTQKSYSDGTTATVMYGYDAVPLTGCTTAPPALAITNGKGRRAAMCDASGGTSWSYDGEGAVLTEKRTIAGSSPITKTVSNTYNLDGSLATLTYPSGRVVTYTLNTAGRTLSAVDAANSINYATDALYTPHGALSSLKNGVVAGGFAGITTTNSYNKRLQPAVISAASVAQTVLSLSYGFNLFTANNGDVINITNNRDNTRTQSFTYDELSRVKTAQTPVCKPNQGCSAQPPVYWGQSFTYDIWANLKTVTVTQGSAPTLNVAVDGNNRITSTGFTYDAAGNLTNAGSGVMTYDAENRLVTVAGVTYTYDGDGKRVKKSNGKLYWTGPGSAVLSETDLAGAIQSEFMFFNGKRISRRDGAGNTVFYYFSDHLGSASVVTNATGTIVEESDYYPFGDEIVVTNSDPNQYKFTGKERDPESGFDYFGARFYAFGLGRFTIPDPLTASAQVGRPQTWNRYAYVLNNPLRWIDPNGLQDADPDSQDDQLCHEDARACETDEFLAEELLGVWDTTAGAVVDMVDQLSSGEAAENFGNMYGEGDVGEKLKEAASEMKDQLKTTVEKVSEGNPRAMGQVAGIIISAKVAAELKVGGKVEGTNKPGQLTSRSSLRKATVQKAWDNAANGSNGGKLCPTCSAEVQVKPGSGAPRDWDVHHEAKWSQRQFSRSATRQQVIDNYQEGTSLRCQHCNRADNAR